ncbi:DNA primase/helicase [Gordonia phage Bantam]|uniref:DNA primase/helicase n=1 Tax=Gordonia phage Bantam TaxID=1887641 RepID=A0A1B3AYE6_9CAUD|nr:DNA primase/helicase [Gordonia phage Bantam]AOE43775.1 DNA primase/helicase [Gordonia phage Bantam]
MGVAFDRVVDRFRDEGLILDQKSANRYAAQAPGHSTQDRSVTITDIGGQVLIHSHSDETEVVLERLGLEMKDLFDSDRGVEYKYSDGRRVHRSPGKDFRQSGNTKGDQLYRVERLGDADTVYVVEGEKDVHALEASGVTAVSTAMGAGKAKMFDWSPLFGRRVVIVRDNDLKGEQHAKDIVDLLAPHCEVEVVQAAVGKDAADHIAAGRDPAEFVADQELSKRAVLSEIWGEFKVASELPPEEMVAHLQRALDRATVKVVREEKRPFVTWDEASGAWWDWYENADPADVIPTPWDFINSSISGGFHRKRSYLFAGRPGEGKSLSLTNIAVEAMRNDFKSVIYSLEMDSNEIVSRVVAAGGDVEYGQITRREMDDHNVVRAGEFIGEVEGKHLFISDRTGLKIEKVMAECRRIHEQEGIDLFMFDYMQLMKTGGKKDRHEQLEEISQGIRQVAKECNAASVSAVQLNRNTATDSRPPEISDLRGSGSIEQDADVIFLIHHEKFEGKPTGEVNFILGKNRTGPLTTHSLDWRPYRASIR